MSDSTPPPRRRIAGETQPPAKKAPAAKKASAKKAPAKTVPAAKKAPVTKKVPATKTPVAKKPVPQQPSSGGSAPQVARPAPRPERPRPARPARSPLSALSMIIASLMLAAGVVVGFLGFSNWNGGSLADSQASAVTAASSSAETIFSFSYDALDEHAKESKAVMTPSYAKQFDAIAPALTDIAPDRKVKVTAVTRNAAALPCGDECSTTKTTVLLFIDQDRRLADDDTSTVFGNRIEVEMVKTDGDWKVNDIRAL